MKCSICGSGTFRDRDLCEPCAGAVARAAAHEFKKQPIHMDGIHEAVQAMIAQAASEHAVSIGGQTYAVSGNVDRDGTLRIHLTPFGSEFTYCIDFTYRCMNTEVTQI